MLKRTLLASACTSLISLMGLIAFPHTPAWAAEPVKIGFIGPLSGGSIDMGESMHNGALLAVEELNKYTGGVLGRPIQLVERDDTAKAEIALSATKELITNDKVIGWKAPLIGSWGLSQRNFLRGAGKNANGVRMPQTFIAASNNFTRSAFLSAYYSKYNTDNIPSAVSAAQAYDAMMLLAGAINEAKSLEGPQIKKALESLKQPVYGTITTYRTPFSKTNHEAVTEQIVVMGEIRNSEVTFAYKEDEADRFRKK